MTDSPTSVTWTSILKEARGARGRFEVNPKVEDATSFLDLYRPHFLTWKEQLMKYASEVSRKGDGNQEPTLTDQMKKLILETRAALRFGLLLVSFEDNNVRLAAQNCAVLEFQWHVPMVSILSQRKCDSKCRLFLAQLLSNLVTSNSETAFALSSMLPISPSDDYISAAILHDLSTATEQSSVGDNENTPVRIQPNWVDMLLSAAKSGNREAFAGITAALHNFLVSLKRSSNSENLDEQKPPFAKKIASDSMLISILLRYFVSSETVRNSIEDNKDGGSEETQVDPWDSATDWIYLLLTKLCRLGFTSSMYDAISGRDPSKSESQGLFLVLPEHIVFLHCIEKEAQAFATAHITDPDTLNPFGGEVGWEATAETYEYLAGLFSELCNNQGTLIVNADVALGQSGILSILGVLSITLGVDSPVSTKLRSHLGTRTSILQDSAKFLGIMVDDLAERSFGKKARELKVSEDDQKLITSLVRLLGNLCFRCRDNQDLMRTTMVPMPTTKTKSKPDAESRNGNGAADKSRNALHVLLSCTSFATSCFTLREWTVIAIRNVLEDNSYNQQVVAELEAQNPVESAALHHAGVRVSLDNKGKVSLSTLNENQDEK